MKHFLTTSLLIASLLVFLKPGAAFSAEGDTTRVRVFDKYLWEWYGSQDRQATFPAADKKFKKVLMKYTLTCPTGGCGEWDYTTNVYFRRGLGIIDSVLKEAVNFTADGKIVDSLSFSYTPTWKTSYHPIKKVTDSTANPAIKLHFFKDPANPARVTDSLSVYRVGYWKYYYVNNNGVKTLTDSAYVDADTTLYLQKTPYHEKFEVKEDIELGRFITPYGKGFPQGWSYTWTFDVTDYQYLLHDSAEIRTRYDGYSRGSLYTLDFEFIEGTPARDVFKIEVIYSGAFEYGNPAKPIEANLPEKTIEIPAEANQTFLRLITTGHGFANTDDAAEFSKKTHTVHVNGEKRFEQFLWRDDCGQNPVFPQAGTWFYQRGGWCPGSEVYPFDYLLTPYVTGNSVKVDYNMQPYTNLVLNKPATYIIQAQIFHSRTALKNDAAIMEIKKPNNAIEYRRMNPAATFEKPIVVLKNNGTEVLKNVKIMYGIDGNLSATYNWTGDLAAFKSTEISLPGIELGEGEHTFKAAISQPNGAGDEYSANDEMIVQYTAAKVYTGDIILELTNNYNPGIPNGTRYEVTDVEGNILFSKDNIQDKAVIRDTFRLADGSYIFTIYDDELGSGLMFPWANGTNGSFLLKDSKDTIYLAKPNYLPTSSWFGDRQKVSFSVQAGGTSVNEEFLKEGFFEIFPNPSDGTTLVRSASEISRVEIFATSGMLLKTLGNISGNSARIDMSGFSAGYYIFRCTTSEGIKTIPFVKRD